jgi:hypothetical protein
MSKILTKQTRTILGVVAIAGLLITLIPSILNWQGIIGPEIVNRLMMWGTVVWFVPAIFLFGGKQKDEPEN